MKRLVLLGPPGVGKGTQAKRLSRELGVPHVSTGALFRDEVERESEIGQQIEHRVASGGFVADAITRQIVENRLGDPDAAHGFVLDGYPRTTEQLADLEEILGRLDTELDAAILIDADKELLTERLLRRASAEGRADDRPEVIRHRFTVYDEQTAPLIAQFDRRGLLTRVDGSGDIDEIAQQIAAAVG